MKQNLMIAALALALAACSHSNSTEASGADEAQADASRSTLSISGTWRLIDYTDGSDMVTVDADRNYCLSINQADSTFGMGTDCNGIGGEFKEKDGTIKFDNITTTLMLCPEAQVEDAMKAIFDRANGYEVSADSVLTLKADGAKLADFKFQEVVSVDE